MSATVGAAGQALMRVLAQWLIHVEERGLEQWLFCGLVLVPERVLMRWLLR